MLFCRLSVFEKHTAPTPGPNFNVCRNSLVFYFLITNWLLSKTSIFTFLSFYPEQTYSITYVLPPGIFKHTGSLEGSLNRMQSIWIMHESIINPTRKVRFVIQSYLSLYFIIYELLGY